MRKRKNVPKEESVSTTKKYRDDSSDTTITTYKRASTFLGSSSPIDDCVMESKAFSVL